MNPDPSPRVSRFSLKKWLGAGGLVAFLVVLGGRMALESLRGMPQFDDRGMDAFSAVEHFSLRQNPVEPDVAFFGSSQTVWGIIPDVAATGLGLEPHQVQSYGVVAGTPFDMLNLLRRNPAKFENLDVAVVEINPVMLAENREEEGRLRTSISQHATLQERGMLRMDEERLRQQVEWAVPLVSVRRTLRTAVLNAVNPAKGSFLCRNPDFRIYPSLDWYEGVKGELRDRHLVPVQVGARRMVGAGNWKVSQFQDHALKRVLEWFSSREIPVVIHQFPLHPEVMDLILADGDFSKSYASYIAYVESLRPLAAGVLRTQYPEECGASVAGMADRMHLNETGARYYSLYVAEKARGVAELGATSSGPDL